MTKTLAAVMLGVLCAAALVWNVALIYAMDTRLHMNDFGKFYYSAQAYLDGRDMYAPTPATDQQIDGAEGLQFLNMNPPHFHLLILPLARLQPESAVNLWIGIGLFALTLSLLLILREAAFAPTVTRLLLVACGTLVFAGTQAFFATGQLSLLLLLAMTICWLDARHGRWLRAAAWLGVSVSVKPFLLIFVPYLIGTRRFRACGVMLATAAGCFAIGVLVFGAGAYASWYRAVGESARWTWASMNASALGIFSRAFDTSPYFAPIVLKPAAVRTWLVPAGLIGIVTLVITIRDSTTRAVDRAFALLLVAAQLISPLGWIYYLWLPAGPVAVLLAEARTKRRSRPLQLVAAVSLAGFAWPFALSNLFQPSRLATVTIASMYFWATLAAWVWLVVDYARPANSSSNPQL